MTDQRIALATAVEALRLELQQAMDQGVGKTLRFDVEALELELQVAATQEGSGNVGIRWWLVEAETDLHRARTTTQTVRLTLRPTVEGPGGPTKARLSGEW